MKKTNPVAWFEIYVDDLQGARKFYETVFDLKMEDLPNPTEESMEMVSFPMDMESSMASGALVKMDGMKPGGNSTIAYFASEDCSVEEARVAAAGGKVLKSKTSLGDYGFMVLAEDVAGNTIGIHSQN